MASVTEEVAVLEQQQSWEELFIDIKKSSQYNLSCMVAKRQENRYKNRYGDVSPYDHSRVKLQNGPSDYINSSLVEVAEANRRYILSQGPLPDTSGHLWQMVWEQNSKAVIMLNKTIENGKNKCHQYWPSDKNYPQTFHDDGYIVTLVSETDMHNFVVREFELLRIRDSKTRIVYQFHYMAWPDFDVPQSPAAFLNYLACIRQYGVLENNYGPAVIHCSAGIGRSGTFILIDACLELLQKGVPFEVHKVLLDMRKYRMGLIQTPHQLRFSYFAIAECERILLFKQHEENGYSDVDGISDDESDGYDQLCREDNLYGEVEDDEEDGKSAVHSEEVNDDVINPKIDEELQKKEEPQTPEVTDTPSNHPTDENTLETTPSPESNIVDDVHEPSLPSIIPTIEENDDAITAQAHRNKDSEALNEPPTRHGHSDRIPEQIFTESESTSTRTSHETVEMLSKDNDVLNDQSVSSEITDQDLESTFPKSELIGAVSSTTTENEEKPLSHVLRTSEEQKPHKFESEQLKNYSQSPTVHREKQQSTQNTDKQKDPSITTFISPEQNTLRKRVFDTSDVSATPTGSDKANVNDHNGDERSWRPYIIGGIIATAMGVLVALYSKL